MTFPNGRDLREYLTNNKIIADGAMGTYFSSRYGSELLPENCNLSDPEKVLGVHKEYISAGAGLIRTNTFASNCETLRCGRDQLAENIRAACGIARHAAAEYNAGEEEKTLFIAGDIGPIPMTDSEKIEQRKEEYRFIVDTMVGEGLRILVFETFAGIDEILPVIHECRERYKEEELFILVQICVNMYGYTNSGHSAASLIGQLEKDPAVDACGLNCGIGPAHMKSVLDGMDLKKGMNLDSFVSVFPNAGFPGNSVGRMVFRGNEEYYALKLREIAEEGADIVGGCCGTSPQFLKKLAEVLDTTQKGRNFPVPGEKTADPANRKNHSFWNLSAQKAAGTDGEGEGTATDKKAERKLIAVELAPPFMADDRKLMDSANALLDKEIDVITLPDSPSGRTRADSILTGLKVNKETGITVMPHLCCRDRNIIAVRSELMGAYLNGLRNFLVITGDPVPTMMRQEAKSVFNFDGVGLMRIIKEMNEEQFAEDPIYYGGAINHNRPNIEVEIRRMHKKIEAGASFFLTQPVFTDEDVEKLRRFREEIDRSGSGAKLMCGLMPLISRRNALFIQNEMTGIDVSDELVERYTAEMTREEGEAVGVGIVRDVIEKTQDIADGYYFSIPFNRVYLLKDILK